MTDDQKDITPRAEVLREAEQLITGDRNETYGTPTQNFTNIAELWNVQFAHLLKDDAKFSAYDVALAQIHVKMARMVAQPKRDNFVDIAGYAACGWEAKDSEPNAMTGVVPPKKFAAGGTFVGGDLAGIIDSTWKPYVYQRPQQPPSVVINTSGPVTAESSHEIAKQVQAELDTRYGQTSRGRD